MIRAFEYLSMLPLSAVYMQLSKSAGIIGLEAAAAERYYILGFFAAVILSCATGL